MSNHDVCPVELARMLDSPFRKLLQKPVRHIKKIVEPGFRIVDLGCGPGSYTLELARLTGPGGRVYGVDIQQGMLRLLTDKAKAAGLDDRIIPVCPEDGEIGVDEKADCVFVFYMLHESKKWEKLVGSIADVLKPGGFLFLAEPKFHVSRGLFEETCSLIGEKGLHIIKACHVTFSRTILFQKSDTGEPRV